jgi:hypothetical protein
MWADNLGRVEYNYNTIDAAKENCMQINWDIIKTDDTYERVFNEYTCPHAKMDVCNRIIPILRSFPLKSEWATHEYIIHRLVIWDKRLKSLSPKDDVDESVKLWTNWFRQKFTEALAAFGSVPR